MHIPRVPERFIRYVWQHQLFHPDSLSTPDGTPVTIFSPGRLNIDGGPDFREARIRIGNVVYRGDVELHVDGSLWQSHRHSDDPHYNRVILHVVLTVDEIQPPATTASHRPVPVLVLHPFLDPRLYEAWHNELLRGNLQHQGCLPCRAYNEEVPKNVIRSFIRSLAKERLELRLRDLEERLHQLIDETRNIVRETYSGYDGRPEDIPSPHSVHTRLDCSLRTPWEQLLYENVMEGMGYAKNSRPFLELARSVRLDALRRFDMRDALTMQSILFGVAGLLPPSRKLPEKESRVYVRELRRRWKELRPAFRVPMLHEGDWLFFRLRPANFPTARLASMSFLLPFLFGEASFPKIIETFRTNGLPPSTLALSMMSLFMFIPDEYWGRHYHFRSEAGRRRIVLGRERIVDILVNTVIPIALLHARIFNDHAVRRGALSLLRSLTSPRGNVITRTVERELIRGRLISRSAFEQQGQLQLYKFYCTAGRCGECAVGKAIRRKISTPGMIS